MLNIGVASVMKQFPLLSREPNRGFVEKGKSLFGNTSLASIFFPLESGRVPPKCAAFSMLWRMCCSIDYSACIGSNFVIV